MKESDKHYEYLRAYIAELAMLEFIKDNNLINDIEYKKIKNRMEKSKNIEEVSEKTGIHSISEEEAKKIVSSVILTNCL